MEHQQDTEIHLQAAARAAVAMRIAGHTSPVEMTLDTAQQLLGQAGYEVTVDPDTNSIVGDLPRGRHRAVVAITPGHLHQLVSQWWGLSPEAIPTMSGQYWPDSVKAAVECALAVAGAVVFADQADVRKAEAAQEGQSEAAEVDQADDGIDFPGLEEACYGADGIEWTDAEAAQDGAEPESAVTA